MRRGLLGALLALLIFAQPAGAQAGRLAFNVDDEVWLMRADGSERQRLTRTPGPAGATQPDFSPDGSTIAFTRGSELSSIWTQGSDPSSARQLTRPPRRSFDWSPDWRADGHTIAFARTRLFRDRITSSLMTIDVRTGRERRLKTVIGRERLLLLSEAAWSPDGARLLYTVTRLDEESRFAPALYVLDVASGKATRLAAKAQTGAWSPDGQRIAFSSVRDASAESCGSDECRVRGELYVMNADGSGLTRLTHNDGDDVAPTWAPDGSAMAFQSSRNAPVGDNYEVYVIRPDGSCLTWLTNGTQESGVPDWQPGTGGLPEPFACGAVPREPTGLITPRGRGLWMGSIAPRNVLLADDEDSYLTYD